MKHVAWKSAPAVLSIARPTKNKDAHEDAHTSAREGFPSASLVGGMKPPEMSIPSHGRHVNIPVGISHPSFSSFSRMNFTLGPVHF